MTLRDSDGAPPALRARGLTKRFGATVALAGVDLAIEQGEVVALLGENCSGKSTLVKILSGFHVPEPGGSLEVLGQDVPLPVPHGRYRQFGLSFVYQDLGLAPGLRVVENLLVGRRTAAGRRALWPIGWRSERRQARRILDSYHVDLDPDAVVGELRPTDQALLAIVRATEDLRAFRGAAAPVAGTPGAGASGILVLDEPTVFLPEGEKTFLFDLVRRVASGGTAVLFVSHDMTAVRQIANRAVVLRDGALSGNVVISETTDEDLVQLLSGHRLGGRSPAMGTRGRAHEPAEAAPELVGAPGAPGAPGALASASTGPILRAENVAGGRLAGASFSLGATEIVGVAGLLGSGAEDLPYALFGALAGCTGRIEVAGRVEDLARLSPRRARALGLSLVPADRKAQGVAMQLDVSENLMSLVLGDYFRKGVLARGQLRRTAAERCHSFGVRPPRPKARLASLSGGNQQRVVLARWLEHPPAVLLLHEPTQGVDVATRADVYAMMRRFADNGIAILWVSTDFDELAAVSDRLLICAGGAVVSELAARPMSRDQITAEVYAAQSVPAAAGA